MKRQVYLDMKDLEEARGLFMESFDIDKLIDSEEIESEEALGRVSSEPVFARLSTPSFHSAAMDGIAVKADKTYGTTERNPMVLEIGKDALWINTGQPMPENYDSVIMVEKLHQVDDEHLEILSSSYPWQNVRKVGEDIVATQLLFPKNHLFRPYDIGALIGAGVFQVRVWQRPRVAVIPTGSELVNHKDLKDSGRLGANQIIEYNSKVLASLVRECGAIPVVYDIVPDSEDEILEAIKGAVASDAHIIMINAGSSAGSKDFTVHAVGKMGDVIAHGIAMMPGKPTILGKVDGKPVVGNPGYPVSSTLSFDRFVRPLLYRLQGIDPPKRESLKVRVSRDIPSKPGIEEFLRVNIGRVGKGYVATPLARAAGSITTLTRAEGIIRIPALSEGISVNEESEAELLVGKDELLNTIVVIGSHDNTIDLIGDEIRQKGSSIRLSSGNVGSLGGLMALKKGICHLAGSHLLDTETGQYNVSYIKKYLKGTRISIFHLVLRDQGLIVSKGNPKAIGGIEDLVNQDASFVNRQAGSGTRILFDYKLDQLGIDPAAIRGYDREEFTHMNVAVDVLSGAADCGMGIFAAAKALDLDFIPVVREQYDLIIPSANLELENVRFLIDTVGSDSFKERVSGLGGYDPSKSGEFWIEI